MTVSVTASGSAVLVVGTEQTLTTITTAGIYQLIVDVSAMAQGDEMEIRVYGRTTAIGDPERQMYMHALWNKQDNALKATIPVMSPVSYRCTLKQTAGTARSCNWSVYLLS